MLKVSCEKSARSSDLRSFFLLPAAITNSVFPACCLLEEWLESATGPWPFHLTFSSPVFRQVGFFPPEWLKRRASRLPSVDLYFSFSSWGKISQRFPGCSAGADKRRGRGLAVQRLHGCHAQSFPCQRSECSSSLSQQLLVSSPGAVLDPTWSHDSEGCLIEDNE